MSFILLVVGCILLGAGHWIVGLVLIVLSLAWNG